MNPARFSHDESQYERPDSKFRCGRAACWAKPCARGPNIDGSCGGVSECEPFFDGNGYQCRRPAAFGGPCEEGPGPDGGCGIRRPPCVPRRSLRGLRGRVTLLFTLFAIATIVALTGNGAWPMLEQLNLSNPGPISGAHARFTEQSGCVTCHQGRDRTGLAWLTEAVTGHDMSGACLECHAFDGPADRPHNADRTPVRGPATLECVACHTEHQGETFDIAHLSDQQCQTCHKEELTFASFDEDHPDFGARFPYDTPAAIRFTHVQHLTKHFPSKSDKRPESETCVSCHDIDHAGPNVPVFSFERMCADCHADQIGRKDLVVLTLPEFDSSLVALTEEEEGAFDSDAESAELLPLQILETCGADFEGLERLEALLEGQNSGEEPEDEDDFRSIDGNEPTPVDTFLFERFEALLGTKNAGEEPEDEDDFLSIGEDEPTPVDAFLLAIDPGDMESYWAPYRALIHAMTQNGAAALHDLVEARFGQGAANPLLAGLESLPLEDMACAWAGNEEYEPEEETSGRPGWSADALEIRYKPARHEDPVMRAWLESALAANGIGSSNENAEELRRSMFSEENGPGRCAYCHSPTQVSAVRSSGADSGVWIALTSRLDWQQRPEVRHQVKYAHGPHINLLGRGTWCTNCHELNKSPNSAAKSDHGQSNGQDPVLAGDFMPIAIQQCKSCHKANGVRQDCSTCHLYHRSTSFRKRMF